MNFFWNFERTDCFFVSRMRKCQNLQWMPSKMFLQKQGKCKKDKRKNKSSDRKEGFIPVKGPASESGSKPTAAPQKEEPARKKSETPPLKLGEEKSKQSSPALASSPASVEPLQASGTAAAAQSPAHTPDAKPLFSVAGGAGKKAHKPPHSAAPTSSSSSSSSSSSTSSSSSSSSSSSPSSSAQNSPSQSTQSHQPSHQHQHQHRPLTGPAPSKKDASPKISLSEPKKKPLQHSSQQQSSTTTVSDIGTKKTGCSRIKVIMNL